MTCKLAYKEGKTNGRMEEQERWMLNHGEGLCALLMESMFQILGDTTVWNEAMTQTDAPVSIDSHETPTTWTINNCTIFSQLPTTMLTSTQMDELCLIPATPTPPASTRGWQYLAKYHSTRTQRCMQNMLSIRRLFCKIVF